MGSGRKKKMGGSCKRKWVVVPEPTLRGTRCPVVNIASRFQTKENLIDRAKWLLAPRGDGVVSMCRGSLLECSGCSDLYCSLVGGLVMVVTVFFFSHLCVFFMNIVILRSFVLWGS